MPKRIGSTFINGLLLLGIVGLLIAYLILASNLPSQIYTETQREYLSYNARRKVSQVAPTWNFVQQESQAAPINLPVQSSQVRATLAARYEEQEGVSVTAYDLDFLGEYHLAHPGSGPTSVELYFPFPDNLETLHEVRFLVDGEEPSEAQFSTQGISWQTVLEPEERRKIEVSYKADGVTSFAYGLHHNQRSDVDVTITVEGLTESQVPKTSLPPTTNEIDGSNQTFTWEYPGLIADRDIQLNLPTRLSFAQRIAQLQDDFRTLAGMAPFLVGLFLASLGGVFQLSDIRLRLAHYLLVGLGVAFFYPLLTFLSGAVGVGLAAALALLLVCGLLLTFLSTMIGWWPAWSRVGLLLVIFLGIFSLGMLTPWRGLLLSVGGLMLVGIFMLLYARRPIEPDPEEPDLDPPPVEMILESELATEPTPTLDEEEPAPEPSDPHCPYCAHPLAEDYRFCPGCGNDTQHVRRCDQCGHTQFVPEDAETVHCIGCGQLLSRKER